ncbi:hypothetical protein H5410_003682 [Solanum commersonii]|uniref:Uncharacterized protein n=1 Tax=Solanum commersonii TaxID=4109 RepID=A0A9J6B5B9_SOLCO|nr:hypothetical protein H5410_003682 [Solanum commersonii]
MGRTKEQSTIKKNQFNKKRRTRIKKYDKKEKMKKWQKLSRKMDPSSQRREIKLGMKSKKSTERLKKLINTNNTNLVAILEPFVSLTKINGYMKYLGFQHSISNDNGIWIEEQNMETNEQKGTRQLKEQEKKA